jgi:hypothetical protein
MPDWQKLVRRRLSGLALGAAEREDICSELASHLEENCEGLLQRGLPEDEAVRRTLSQVADWQDLQRRVQNARTKESIMTNRVKQFWLPGLLTLVLSMVILALIQIFGPKPLTVAWNGRSGASLVAPVATVYIPWLLSLPFVGAMGAFLSHRAGGSQRAVFSSIVFPVLPYLTVFLVGFPVALILDDHVAHNIMLSAFLVALVVWVLVPGAVLLAGGLPVQLFLLRRLASRQVVRN